MVLDSTAMQSRGLFSVWLSTHVIRSAVNAKTNSVNEKFANGKIVK